VFSGTSHLAIGVHLFSEIVKRYALVGALLGWLLAVGVGLGFLLRYANTPGRLAAPPNVWPRLARIRPEPGRAILLVFAHPQCPCTRATIGELAEIMARSQGSVDAYVYFYAPRSEGSGWVRSPLWRDAAAIPRVHAIEDAEGGELRKFGASTSGQVLLYDAAGQLQFNGGITASRGHAGDNDGRDAVSALLQSGRTTLHATSVFGCSLLDEE
jgi:hypothetical protein